MKYLNFLWYCFIQSQPRRKRKLLPRVLQTLFGKCTSDLLGKVSLKKRKKLNAQLIGGAIIFLKSESVCISNNDILSFVPTSPRKAKGIIERKEWASWKNRSTWGKLALRENTAAYRTFNICYLGTKILFSQKQQKRRPLEDNNSGA